MSGASARAYSDIGLHQDRATRGLRAPLVLERHGDDISSRDGPRQPERPTAAAKEARGVFPSITHASYVLPSGAGSRHVTSEASLPESTSRPRPPSKATTRCRST